MENQKYTLDGKMVTIFLRGGWSFTGKVEYISDTQIILDEGEEDGFISIYRPEMVAARVHPDTQIKTPEVSRPIPRSNPSNLPQEVDLEQDYLNENSNHYGSLIPEDMLDGEPDPYDVDLSMSSIDFGAEIKKKEPKKKRKASL